MNLSRQAQGSYDSTSSRAITAGGCGFQLFGWIPITVLNRAERAYAALVKQAPDAFITEVKVQERWTYAFIGTVYCTQLEAVAYSRR